MKHIHSIVIAALIALGLIHSPFCFSNASASWELYGGANASFGVQERGSSFGSSTSSDVSIDLSFTGGYFLNPQWELLLGVHTQVITASDGNTIFTPRAGLEYNFSEDTSNSLFIGALAGPSIEEIASSGNNYVVLSYWIHAGKRFALVDHVSWAPEVFVSGHSSGSTTSGGTQWELGSLMQFGVQPLLISVLF